MTSTSQGGRSTAVGRRFEPGNPRELTVRLAEVLV